MKHCFCNYCSLQRERLFSAVDILGPKAGEFSHPILHLPSLTHKKQVANGPTWKPSVAPCFQRVPHTKNWISVASCFCTNSPSLLTTRRKRPPAPHSSSQTCLLKAIGDENHHRRYTEDAPVDSEAKAWPLRLGSALPSNPTQELSREITEKGLVGSTVSWDLSLSQ